MRWRQTERCGAWEIEPKKLFGLTQNDKKINKKVMKTNNVSDF